MEVVGTVNSAGIVPYDDFEICLSNLLAGIHRTPFDTALLTNKIRAITLRKAAGECLDRVDVYRVGDSEDKMSRKIASSLIDLFGDERGDIKKIYYISAMYDTFLKGVFSVISRWSEDNIDVYSVDMSLDQPFSTVMFLMRDVVTDMWTISIPLGQNSFGEGRILTNDTSSIDRLLMGSSLLRGDGGAPVFCMVTANFEEKPGYETMEDTVLLEELHRRGYSVYYTMDEQQNKTYMSMPCWGLLDKCVYSRKLFEGIEG